METVRKPENLPWRSASLIELRTFGHVGLTPGEGGDADALVAQPKRFALFCYLAFPKPGILHRRDTLLGLFWPNVDQEHARMDLRQSLIFIRHALREDVLLRCGDDEVGVNPDLVWCDVAEFQCAVEDERWSDAVGLYCGEFLQGYHLSGDLEFERWLDGERTRLVRAYAMALERAVDVAAAGNDVRAALEYSERLVEHDPYNSRYAIKLVQALAVANDPANALLCAKQHAELLREELDIAPPRELQALVRWIRQLESEGSRPPVYP
jgi:DNA-binding SARP family transcriptional activator